MVAERMEAQRFVTRRPYFSAIRWGAIFGGLVSGVATYILLSLLGVAVGLTLIDPGAAEPVGNVPVGTGIWTGISMLIAAFVGGYVAARMSGLARQADGLLHGLVSWGATTLLFAFLVTTAVGALLGGTFGILGQGLQGVTTGVAQDGTAQFEALLTGTEQGQITTENMQALQQQLQAGNRQGAVNVMVNQMGFTQERANQLVDPALAVMGPGAEQQLAGAAEQAVDAMSAASWWLFFGMLLSLGMALWGGTLGVRATSSRVAGEHAEVGSGGMPGAGAA